MVRGFFGKRKSLTEAAHVPSQYLTEPMRADHRCPRPWAALDAAEDGDEKRVTACGSSSPFCLAVTWHGEVSGAPRRAAPRKRPVIAKAVDVWERTSARPRIAVWCRLGIATDKRNSEPRTIPAQKFADSASDC